MTPIGLLGRLKALGIKLERHNDKIKVDAPKGTLTSEIKQSIVAHKSALLEILTLPANVPNVPNVPCWNCKSARLWKRPSDGGWVCAVCHPPLPDCAIVEFATRKATYDRMAREGQAL